MSEESNEDIYCSCCDKLIENRDDLRIFYYLLDPWDKKDEYKYFCSDECEDLFIENDEMFYFCSECGNTMLIDNGSNYNYVAYDWGSCCLKCNEEMILDEGYKLGNFEDYLNLPGIFLDEKQAENNGYILFKELIINNENTVEDIKEKCISFIKNGFKVLIEKDSFSYDTKIKIWLDKKFVICKICKNIIPLNEKNQEDKENFIGKCPVCKTDIFLIKI